MTRVLYPGSFDPVHNGHLELVTTASALFDEVIVAAGLNPSKRSLFDLDDREAMLEESFVDLSNVSTTRFSTLVVDVAREHDCDFIVKGLRAVSDFESEMHMAHMNKAVSGVETIFIPCASDSSFIASKLIREIATYGGDISSMVPEPVVRRLTERFPQ